MQLGCVDELVQEILDCSRECMHIVCREVLPGASNVVVTFRRPIKESFFDTLRKELRAYSLELTAIAFSQPPIIRPDESQYADAMASAAERCVTKANVRLLDDETAATNHHQSV